jgi:hypothetical protein
MQYTLQGLQKKHTSNQRSQGVPENCYGNMTPWLISSEDRKWSIASNFKHKRRVLHGQVRRGNSRSFNMTVIPA